MNDTAFLEERLGTTLKGKWKLERLLGCGGMAAVYVGLHNIGKRHAIKILHPEVAASPDVRARFEQEAHAVNLLHHPGAVEIHDFDVSEDGCPFLVMELLEGETLGQRLNREKHYDLRELLAIADQTLEVLAVAHAEGIVHRDIKPANLFLLSDGRVKVLDFGVARMLEGARAVHTRLGTALGTPTYMSPEQARGEPIDGRADVFSVGGTLFRAITRQRIHRCESDADLLVAMATLPAPPLGSVAKHVSDDVCMVVDRSLAFQREQRYPHARVMQRDVRALLAGQTPPYASKRPLNQPSTPMPLVAAKSSGRPTIPSTPAAVAGAESQRRLAPTVSDRPPPKAVQELAANDEPTSAEVPAARVPSWPVAETVPELPSAPPQGGTAPMAPMGPVEPWRVQPPVAATVPDSQLAPYPQNGSSKALWWIALLLVGVLMLLVGGTLGGWWLLRSGGTLDQMEAK